MIALIGILAAIYVPFVVLMAFVSHIEKDIWLIFLIEKENDMDINTATEIAFKNGYKEGKQEVAREIFEEIERTCVDTFGYFYIGATHGAFAELKKKYTEDKT